MSRHRTQMPVAERPMVSHACVYASMYANGLNPGSTQCDRVEPAVSRLGWESWECADSRTERGGRILVKERDIQGTRTSGLLLDELRLQSTHREVANKREFMAGTLPSTITVFRGRSASMLAPLPRYRNDQHLGQVPTNKGSIAVLFSRLGSRGSIPTHMPAAQSIVELCENRSQGGLQG